MELKYAPWILIIDQSVLCNQECFFCWRTDRDMTKQKIQDSAEPILLRDLYDEIVRQGAAFPSITWLGLCGPMGEPLLVPDIASRGKFGRDHGLNTILNTNGYLLKKHDPEEIMLGFKIVNVSLDAVDNDIYKKIHGKDHMEKVLSNVLLLARSSTRKGSGKLSVRFTEMSTTPSIGAYLPRRWPD